MFGPDCVFLLILALLGMAVFGWGRRQPYGVEDSRYDGPRPARTDP